MAVIDMTATRVWVKQVTTNIFYRGTRYLFGAEFMKRRRKGLIGIALILWITGILAGYGAYRRAAENFHTAAVDRIRTELAQEIEAARPGRLAAFDRMVETLAPFIFLRDVPEVKSVVEAARTKLTGLRYLEVRDGEDELYSVGVREAPLRRRSDIDRIGPVAVAMGISPRSEVVIELSADSRFTDSDYKVGEVYFFADGRIQDPTPRYRLLLAVWVLGGIPLLLLLMGTGLNLAVRMSEKKKMTRFVVALIAYGLFQKEKRSREKMVFWTAVCMLHQAEQKAREARLSARSERRIGAYVLRDNIGRGGMAELFIAEKIREGGFRKVVALKKILPHLAEEEEFTDRFIQEARLAALLHHPNIVATNDFGKFEEDYIIVMEYIRGKNLAEIMKVMKRGMALEQAVYIITQICRGLAYSHNKRDDLTGRPLHIIHRDVSPQNVLVSFQGEVKISDFGIAKAGFDAGLTQTGAIMGKLCYLSPEQAMNGETVDHRADIYAVGIIFYEILSGRRVYQFRNPVEAINVLPKMKIPPLGSVAPDIPEEIERIVMKALEKDKRVRYQTVDAMESDLENVRRDFTITYDMNDLSRFMQIHFPGSPMRRPDTVFCSNLWPFICEVMNR